MHAPDSYTITAVLGVCAFYVLSWMVISRGPRRGTIVPLYAVPQHLSPARLRYAWKRSFDDRTFWAAVLSVISKGFATMSTEQGATVLRQAPASNLKESLSPEEKLLTKELLGHGARKGIRISMTDFPTTLLVGRMADMMRRDALGVWFRENRAPVVAGTVLSAIAVIIAARPRWRDEWLALGLSLVIMAPAAFYLPFLVLRLHDLYRTAHQKLDADVVRRAGILLAWVLPSAAGITVGCVELGVTFGWPVLAVTAMMTSLDVWFLHFMRTPTADGRLLLDEIEGFRLFLREVDRLSMAQSEAPKNHPGLYEKYLPYAVALEVEQPWSDRFVALASTFPHDEGIKKSQSFYLGMWNGEPIEIIYSPKLR
jgi:hypothetical protein